VPYAAWAGRPFYADEEPVADTGWYLPKATVDVVAPVGSLKDSAVTLGIGGKRRVIEMYMTTARLRYFLWYVGMAGPLADWDSPQVIENAFLLSCDVVEAMTGSYGTTVAQRRVRMEFIATP
jgi:hypothetical protein